MCYIFKYSCHIAKSDNIKSLITHIYKQRIIKILYSYTFFSTNKITHIFSYIHKYLELKNIHKLMLNLNKKGEEK